MLCFAVVIVFHIGFTGSTAGTFPNPLEMCSWHDFSAPNWKEASCRKTKKI